MLKLFTDNSFLTPANRKFVFPLLFDLHYKEIARLNEYYRIVPTLEEADIAVVPIGVSHFFHNGKQKWLTNFITQANNLNVPVWIYSEGDIGITVAQNVYTFRLGGFDSKLDPNTFILPSFIGDPYNSLGKFQPLEKTVIPRIGFVGNASPSKNKITKDFLIHIKQIGLRIIKRRFYDSQAFYPSAFFRYKFLSRLSADKRVKTDFILRSQYRAGAVTDEQRTKTQLEFFENISDNLYTFCLRGAGNFSVRLYETLAMGRIPLVIDTDMRLPLPELIEWENHCVIADEFNFIEKLVHFHDELNPEEIQQMQIRNRQLWKEYLTRESYFIRMHQIFTDKLR